MRNEAGKIGARAVALVLRADNSNRQNPSLWKTVLPAEIFQINEELTKVDGLLDDERFFGPFRERFGTLIGRPTTAVVTYLRLMYPQASLSIGLRSIGKGVHRRPCLETLSNSWQRGISACFVRD